MKRLTLVRHAKSSRKDASIPDFYRPLSDRGWDEAPEMGRRLAAAGVKPDAFLSSPANRAWSTSREIAQEINFPPDALRAEGSIYDAEVDTLLAVLRGLEPVWEHVLLVGHNPGLTDLAHLLTGEYLEALPTCGILSLALDVPNWADVGEGAGKVIFSDSPG